MSFEENRYQIYKIVHLTAIMIMMTGFSVSFFGINSRLMKILGGIATFLVLVGGMGLMKALAIPHGEPWPLWIKLKFAIWFIVGIGGAMVAKRFPKYGKPAYFVTVIFFIVAAIVANYKFD